MCLLSSTIGEMNGMPGNEFLLLLVYSMPIVTIITIVLPIICGTIRYYLQWKERMQEMRLVASHSDSSSIMQSVQEMRREMIQIRDTMTHCNISNNQTLQRLDERLSYLESTQQNNIVYRHGKRPISTGSLRIPSVKNDVQIDIAS
jgi:hypothetical protein